MGIKVFFIAFLVSLIGCATKHSDMEICFENVQSRIKSDSVLKKLMYCSIDSYGHFAPIIVRAINEESKSDSICSLAINKFFRENNENSITVNNLILFQQFQAYLKHEKFNHSRAKDIALKYESKWK
jgi:hypothetical protein